jgi:Zn finger protein HypA/HybF involved in hydrogenase expression
MENSQEVLDAATTHQMYCVKCRTMVTVVSPKRIVMKSSRHALQGKCPHCTTHTYKIVAKK